VIYFLNHQITKSLNHLKLSTIIKTQTSGLHRCKATGLVERKLSSVVSKCSHIPQSIAISPPPVIHLSFITTIILVLSATYTQASSQSNNVTINVDANNRGLSKFLVDSIYPNLTILLRSDIPEAILVALQAFVI